ncbi:hypothetical protein SNEBB_009876 [Seison nebaliae]|nr:hypothetical protein SNEBB_009876 [Seison nebaliae]
MNIFVKISLLITILLEHEQKYVSSLSLPNTTQISHLTSRPLSPNRMCRFSRIGYVRTTDMPNIAGINCFFFIWNFRLGKTKLAETYPLSRYFFLDKSRGFIIILRQFLEIVIDFKRLSRINGINFFCCQKPYNRWLKRYIVNETQIRPETPIYIGSQQFQSRLMDNGVLSDFIRFIHYRQKNDDLSDIFTNNLTLTKEEIGEDYMEFLDYYKDCQKAGTECCNRIGININEIIPLDKVLLLRLNETTEERIINEYKHDREQLKLPSTCPATWDGFLCQPITRSGESSVIECPKYAISDPCRQEGGPSLKTCTYDGIWERKNGYEFTNFECYQKYRPKLVLIVSCTFYAISFLLLIPSVIIFYVYRKTLRENEHVIHKHFFVSLILTSVAAIIWELVFEYSIYERTRNVYIQNNSWICIMVQILRNYARSTNYFWMLCEGFALFCVFTDMVLQQNHFLIKNMVTIALITGWVLPIFPIAVYVLMKLLKPDKNVLCWTEVDASIYILAAPNVLTILINFIIFIIIIYKIITMNRRQEDSNGMRKSWNAALFLIPLFGAYFVVQVFPIKCRSQTGSIIYELFQKISEGVQGSLVACIYCYRKNNIQRKLKISYKNFRFLCFHDGSRRKSKYRQSFCRSSSMITHNLINDKPPTIHLKLNEQNSLTDNHLMSNDNRPSYLLTNDTKTQMTTSMVMPYENEEFVEKDIDQNKLHSSSVSPCQFNDFTESIMSADRLTNTVHLNSSNGNKLSSNSLSNSNTGKGISMTSQPIPENEPLISEHQNMSEDIPLASSQSITLSTTIDQRLDFQAALSSDDSSATLQKRVPLTVKLESELSDALYYVGQMPAIMSSTNESQIERTPIVKKKGISKFIDRCSTKYPYAKNG